MAVHRLIQRILWNFPFRQMEVRNLSLHHQNLTPSAMDDASNTANRSYFADGDNAAAGDEDEEEEEEEEDDGFCDVEAWETLSRSFMEVQSLLERNRRLIQQVNDNHRSKIPHNLAKNVDLICEINANMSKVISLYSGLSANLSAVVRQRRAAAAKENQIMKWASSNFSSLGLGFSCWLLCVVSLDDFILLCLGC